MKVYIYCLLDNNVPIYIGKTKNSLHKRKLQHQNRLNKKLEIFELDLVDETEFKLWESYYIDLFKSWNFTMLNQNKGGGGPLFHSDESKSKMKYHPHLGTSEKLKGKPRPDVSKSRKGTKLSEETKLKIKKAKTNHECYKNPKRGEKIKETNKKNYEPNSERNKKISSKLLGRKTSWMVYRKKPIIQYNIDMTFIKEWPSASDAGVFINKKPSAINECCLGKRKTAYGYIWKYK